MTDNQIIDLKYRLLDKKLNQGWLSALDEQIIRDCDFALRADRRKDETGGWFRIVKVTCDICSNRAVWHHVAGGYRCSNCPRPGDE